MSEEERLLCPLCSSSYADTASGRGMFKRHVRMAHLPTKKTFIRTFKQRKEGNIVDVAVHRYICPFPECEEMYISRERLWAHFRRKDHFRYILIKNKRV